MPKPKPSTISRDPYATNDPYAFIPKSEEPEARVPEPIPVSTAKTTVEKPEKITTPFPSDLIERARNAVYWEPDLTLAGLIVEAVAEALTRMEQERGGPFPPRNRKLRSGRPIGTGKSKENG